MSACQVLHVSWPHVDTCLTAISVYASRPYFPADTEALVYPFNTPPRSSTYPDVLLWTKLLRAAQGELSWLITEAVTFVLLSHTPRKRKRQTEDEQE